MHKGRGGFRGFVPALPGDESGPLSPAMRHLVGGLWEECCATDAAVQDLGRQLEKLASEDEACRRPMMVPGVGALVSTAMIASVADRSAFARGRDFAAWLGLVPQQMSTGGKGVPCATATSTCRSFATIAPGSCFFPGVDPPRRFSRHHEWIRFRREGHAPARSRGAPSTTSP